MTGDAPIINPGLSVSYEIWNFTEYIVLLFLKSILKLNFIGFYPSFVFLL